jgi:hypothetical protein
MEPKQTKNKPKRLIERLAPAYIVIAIVMFTGMLLVNFENLKYQQPVEVLSWCSGGMGAALAVLLFMINSQMEKDAKVDVETAAGLQIMRWLFGMVFLIPAILVAAGLDLSHVIGTYYVNHGHADAVYEASGLMPSAGLLSIAIVSLSVVSALYLFILGHTPLRSAVSLLKLVISIGIAVPILIVLFMVSFAANYQF